ncbi:MAG: hypothetical protein ACLTS6_00365 [Anaerobutyricum sp.]
MCTATSAAAPCPNFVFQDMINKRGLTDQFYIDSRGNKPRGNRQRSTLRNGKQDAGSRDSGTSASRCTRMTKKTMKYDYLIGMDEANIRNMTRIAGGDPDGKIHMLLDFGKAQERLQIHGIPEILMLPIGM